METKDKKRVIKIVREKEPVSKTTLTEKTTVDSFWHHKSNDELIKEQGVKPIKNEEDFKNIHGVFPDWDDIDEFLEEVHRPSR